MANPYNYCPICGVQLALGHQCDEKRLARIEVNRKGLVNRRERQPSFGQRLADGYGMRRDDDIED